MYRKMWNSLTFKFTQLANVAFQTLIHSSSKFCMERWQWGITALATFLHEHRVPLKVSAFTAQILCVITSWQKSEITKGNHNVRNSASASSTTPSKHKIATPSAIIKSSLFLCVLFLKCLFQVLAHV